ncbi:uncharacterized protein LOC123550708 [Mercenaria mercenaria]|uniref:uncharacterized protein LOC123550708 n=1 Tax=Mercenaria mercenaria TaxID=6596 RepID=UPI00234E39B6|nr:uncharacterized protein LOC123550708 [Mercenaria mercenaria]
MKVVKPRGLEFIRAKMTKESTVMEYFEHLERCISRHDLADKPHLIFNIDEKGLTIDHKPPYVVGSSTSTVQAVTSGKGQTVTMIGCGSASGVSIPPFFVFQGKRMNSDLLNGASPGASGTMSESGWSNTDVFRKYLKDHFMKFAPGRQGEKIILLLDGHRSHVAVDLAEWAKQMNIIIFVLPAHTSHILQPLDVACYGPFQRIYNNLCHKVMRQTSAAITRYNICEIACKAYSKALCAENLHAAFQRTGIYPINKEAIPKEHMIPSEVFCSQTVANEDGNDSDATVEGGITTNAATPEDLFEKQTLKLKNVKSKLINKPRKTMSKLVSGKELTSDEVCEAIQQHIKDQQKPTKKPAKKTAKMSKLVKKSPMKKSVSPKPGPSHINLLASSESSCDEDIEDEEKCCVCGLFTPTALANAVSITFAKWAQCDGMVNGYPCNHWTHLIHCTNVRVIRRGDTFLCPHCEVMEE